MNELQYPDSLLYTVEHVWVRLEDDGTATVGISDFAQDQLGEVAYVDLPSVGAEFAANAEFGTVESIKSVSPLYMPLQGTVIVVNEALADTPTLVNMGPYGDGWMLKITPAPDADRAQLVPAAVYKAGLA